MAQKQDSHLKEWVLDSGKGVEKVVRETAEQTAKDNLDLDQRMGDALSQMNMALMKLSAVEQALLLTLEPRLNKIETEVAELESQRRAMVTRMKSNAASSGPEATAPATEPETAKTDPVAPSSVGGVPTSPPGIGAAKVYSMSSPPLARQGLEQVPWPTPSEVARAAATSRSFGKAPDRAAGDTLDPELRKNVWERKGFNRRLSKYTSEKGAQEFRDWAYEFRRVTSSDRHFH